MHAVIPARHAADFLEQRGHRRRFATAGYANPVAYFLQALAVNELECENWDTPARGDSGLTQGQLFLEQRGYFLGYHWVWLGLIVWGIGSTLLNTSLFMTVSSFLTTGGRKQVAFNRANEGRHRIFEGMPCQSTAGRGCYPA